VCLLQALTEGVYSLLLALNNVKEHPCITFFLQKAFPELQVSLCMSHLTVENGEELRLEICNEMGILLISQHVLWILFVGLVLTFI
jgi:hypothetical protein